MKAIDALASIPRDLFIPSTIWVPQDDGRTVPLCRTDDPALWERLVHSDDEPIIVQTDHGRSDHTTGTYPTSSSTAPRVMAAMIDALDLREGMTVLEIGTGTGYNAAVLALIVGTAHVTTVEIDPAMADHARRALHEAGYPVTVITADGLHGYPPNAPYDRIIVTASAHRIPYTWIEQTTPGGRIMVPCAPTIHPEWPLALLTVHPDGTATGHFISPGYFMPLRGQHLPADMAHTAEARWATAGNPDLSRFGITITPHSQRLWLDSPDNPIGNI